MSVLYMVGAPPYQHVSCSVLGSGLIFVGGGGGLVAAGVVGAGTHTVLVTVVGGGGAAVIVTVTVRGFPTPAPGFMSLPAVPPWPGQLDPLPPLPVPDPGKSQSSPDQSHSGRLQV